MLKTVSAQSHELPHDQNSILTGADWESFIKTERFLKIIHFSPSDRIPSVSMLNKSASTVVHFQNVVNSEKLVSKHMTNSWQTFPPNNSVS